MTGSYCVQEATVWNELQCVMNYSVQGVTVKAEGFEAHVGLKL